VSNLCRRKKGWLTQAGRGRETRVGNGGVDLGKAE